MHASLPKPFSRDLLLVLGMRLGVQVPGQQLWTLLQFTVQDSRLNLWW